MIETYMGACFTITFINKSYHGNDPVVWVCESQAAYFASLGYLRSLKHIEILQAGPSHVKGCDI